MATDRPIIVCTEGSDPIPLDWLKERADVREVPYDAPELSEHLAVAEGLLVRTYTKVTAAFLDQCPKLRVVGRGGVGIENIDVKACRARGIEVVYTPDANTLAVGDFVFGYILQLIRPWNFFKERAYTPKEFKHIRATVRGRQLNEMTLGIVGMGRVGKRMLKIANGFGMKVLYNDVIDVGPLDFPATKVDKETLFRQSDVVSLHVTMLPGNDNMIGRDLIGLMKPDAILINTSRGEVLDAQALADAIKAKKIFGAALDVYWPEPPPADFPLLGLDNVLLTPHLAARTGTALENMSWVVKDVWAVLQGESPKYPAPVHA
ncbi:MAG: NAD(P)-dependent oxidoreductase [Tepidisphaeraceae bacterium]